MSFSTLKTTRANILKAIQDFTPQQLNHIPPGFNNNLVWNLGHVIVTQQLLCYGRSGLDFTIDSGLIDQYRKGSKPESFVSEESINQLKSMAIETVDQMEAGKWYLENIRIPECSHEAQFVIEGLLCATDDSGYKQGYEAINRGPRRSPALRSGPPPPPRRHAPSRPRLPRGS